MPPLAVYAVVMLVIGAESMGIPVPGELTLISASPLAGALRVPYPKFLLANASGGIVWASGTTFVVYFAGQAAERWLNGFGWVALLLALLFGLATTLYLRYRAVR